MKNIWLSGGLFFVFLSCFSQKSLESYASTVSRQIYKHIEPYRSAPDIRIINSPAFTVKYIANPRATISISKGAFDLCRELKNDSINALSVLIGHELAHIHLKHEHLSNQAFEKYTELQADYLGVWYAFVAGYESLQVYALLVDKISTNFGQTIDSDRLLKIKELEKSLETLFYIHEVSTFFKSIQEYALANELMGYLDVELGMPFVKNNLTVLRLLDITNKIGYSEFPYQLPLIWDHSEQIYEWHSNLTRSLKSPEVIKQLDECISELELLVRKFPEYRPAKVNLMCAYVLMNDFHKAQELAEDMTQDDDAQIILKIVRAIESNGAYQNDPSNSVEPHPINLANELKQKDALNFNISDWFLSKFHVASRIENRSLKSLAGEKNYEFVFSFSDQIPISIYQASGKIQSYKVETEKGTFFIERESRTVAYPNRVAQNWIVDETKSIRFIGNDKAYVFSYFLSPY